MRIAVLLLLLLAAPAAHAQEAAAPAAQGLPLRTAPSPLRQAAIEIPALPGERQASEATSREAARSVKAEPSGRDFMYQILMTAVSALITALIWKAVF
jgi:hypothetical protein